VGLTPIKSVAGGLTDLGNLQSTGALLMGSVALHNCRFRPARDPEPLIIGVVPLLKEETKNGLSGPRQSAPAG
jgi:hypothetical protein